MPIWLELIAAIIRPVGYIDKIKRGKLVPVKILLIVEKRKPGIKILIEYNPKSVDSRNIS